MSQRAHGWQVAKADEGDLSEHSENTKKRTTENSSKMRNSNLNAALCWKREKLQLLLPTSADLGTTRTELGPPSELGGGGALDGRAKMTYSR